MTLGSIIVFVLFALVAMMALPIRLFKSDGYNKRLTLLELRATHSKRYKREMVEAKNQKEYAERALIRNAGSLARIERRQATNALNAAVSNGRQNIQLK